MYVSLSANSIYWPPDIGEHYWLLKIKIRDLICNALGYRRFHARLLTLQKDKIYDIELTNSLISDQGAGYKVL